MDHAALPLPEKVDVAIIGGGAVGVFAALALRNRGLSVAVLEKGRVAAEQSSRNWGYIRKQARDLREMPLMMEADRIWGEIGPLLGEKAGYARRGVAYLARDEKAMARHEAWAEATRGYQLGGAILNATETAALLNREADGTFIGCAHMPSDASAEPAHAIPEAARLAAERGAVVIEACAVRGLDIQAGAVRGVLTERGRIGCEAAILAGGAWSRSFMENLGLSLPQLAVGASAQRTAPAPALGGPACIGAEGASVRRRADGGYTIAKAGAARFDIVPAAFRHLRAFLPLAFSQARTISLRLGASFFGPMGARRWAADETTPFERWRVLDPAPERRLLDRALLEAERLHPQLGKLTVVERWGGLIDVTPDEIPIIDAAPGLRGLVVATGLSGHGFGFGPGAARLAVDLATGRSPCVDAAPFRLARFSRSAAA